MEPIENMMCFALDSLRSLRFASYPRILRVFGATLITLSTEGCIMGGLEFGVTFSDRDVSHKKDLWGGYEIGATYELVTDVFLEREQAGDPSKVLVPPGGFPLHQGRHHCAPGTVAQYRAGPAAYPDVIGVVEAETRIRLVSIHKRGYSVWGYTLEFLAIICDGAYKNERVEISDLSLWRGEQKGMVLNWPIPEILVKSPYQGNESA